MKINIAASWVLCVLILFSIGCGTGKNSAKTTEGRIPGVTPQLQKEYETTFPQLLEKYGVHTAGVGVIKNAELVWAGYFGEHAPGIPASATTQFDVASITKTVAAETILRLVEKGLLDLDESMAAYYLEPGIANDPRAPLITPRMALTHSTGFPNWRFFDESNNWRFNPNLPLRFLFEPGSAYGYSGEGMEYVAQYAQNKLKRDFEQLVIDEVFKPLGMTHVSLSCRKANFPNIVYALDANGNFNGHYCRPGGSCRQEGEWSAADDLRVSVPDLAKFLIAVMQGDGYGAALEQDRNRVQVETYNVPESVLVRCEHLPEALCPEKQGYGLGWEVVDYGSYKMVSHGGSDFSEIALAYFYTDTKDGLIILLNAPNERAVAMMPEAIELIHPGSPITPHYVHW